MTTSATITWRDIPRGYYAVEIIDMPCDCFDRDAEEDSTATTGPRAVLQPIVGTVVELIRRPEGTGTGKPEETVDVLITKYTETNPVDDMIKWAVEGQCSDDIATTTQA